jgi:hypothetical protein
MNIYKKILILVLIFGSLSILLYFVLKPLHVTCKTKEDCPFGQKCDNNECKPISNCETKEDCNNHGTCSSGNRVCNQGWSGDNCKTQNSPSTPSINKQPDSSIQIVNNTSENYLHVMFECNIVDQQRYCDDIKNGDFTVYCYEYNDLNSSPWLAAPHKVKVIYNDL